MKLGKKQEQFALDFARLIAWVYGYKLVRSGKPRGKLRLGEVWRSKVAAEHYAATGKGIINSLHRSKLAADIVLVLDDEVTYVVDDYAELGEHWKSLHSDNCWGGDFTGKVARDAGHISRSHGGRK